MKITIARKLVTGTAVILSLVTGITSVNAESAVGTMRETVNEQESQDQTSAELQKYMQKAMELGLLAPAGQPQSGEAPAESAAPDASAAPEASAAPQFSDDSGRNAQQLPAETAPQTGSAEKQSQPASPRSEQQPSAEGNQSGIKEPQPMNASQQQPKMQMDLSSGTVIKVAAVLYDLHSGGSITDFDLSSSDASEYISYAMEKGLISTEPDPDAMMTETEALAVLNLACPADQLDSIAVPASSDSSRMQIPDDSAEGKTDTQPAADTGSEGLLQKILDSIQSFFSRGEGTKAAE